MRSETYREICIEIGEFGFDMQRRAFDLWLEETERRSRLSMDYFLLTNDYAIEKAKLERKYDTLDKFLDATIEGVGTNSSCDNGSCNAEGNVSLTRRGHMPNQAIDIRCGYCRKKLHSVTAR